MDPVELARKVLSQPASELGVGIEAVRALLKSSPRAHRRPYTIIEALHDRRLPGSKANIDHLVVTASGVWVIDAKRYSGRVAKVDKGGWFRTDMRLTVGGRDRTKLIGGVHKQVGHVQAALAEVPGDEPPVHGALCFVDADWALFRKPMTFDGVLVTWSKALRKRLVEDGPVDEEHRAAIHRSLARLFPPGG